jgi:hypothetical protein
MTKGRLAADSEVVSTAGTKLTCTEPLNDVQVMGFIWQGKNNRTQEHNIPSPEFLILPYPLF